MKNQITFSILFIMLGFCSLQAQVTQEWVARYNGPGNTDDETSLLAVDSSGNVYVVGNTYRIGTGLNWATIKYNSSGVLQWIQSYPGSYAYSLAVDGSGNVYVTGSGNLNGNSFYITMKYNSSGDLLWVSRYDENGNAAASSLAIDDSGNVYVTGVQDMGLPLYVTIKYNSSGVQKWIQTYPGGGASSIAVDGSGNVYVTGYVGSGNQTAYATIKYNSSGIQQWIQSYNGSVNSIDRATSMSLDGSGNVYVTGISNGSGNNTDYATIKYNSSGVEQWVQRYGPIEFAKIGYPPSITIDDSGNVYVAGNNFVQSGGNNTDYATIKYNSSGDSLWVARYDGPGNRDDVATSVGVDGLGNVYVTGSSTASGNNIDYATIKYNSSGVQQWVQGYNGPGNGSDYARSIAVDGLGNVYVTGSSSGTGTGLDYATIKYSQSTGITQTSNSIPEKYSLSQNYPNPFNPNTVISYQLSVSSITSLKIYDVLGNNVSTLVNEKQNAGTYEVEFDGSNFSSGIYFYKLQTDNFTETKKMNLIK